jgi:hypothetical protein
MTRWVVRVSIISGPDTGQHVFHAGRVQDTFLHLLDKAGLIKQHPQYDSEVQVFDLLAPRNITDTKVWANQNAQRMQSFGYNAVAAPATEKK